LFGKEPPSGIGVERLLALQGTWGGIQMSAGLLEKSAHPHGNQMPVFLRTQPPTKSGKNVGPKRDEPSGRLTMTVQDKIYLKQGVVEVGERNRSGVDTDFVGSPGMPKKN